MSLSLSKNKSTRLLQFYYLATPLFIFVGWLFEMNIRVTIPGGSDSQYYIYYGICLVASVLTLKSDLLAALIALLECSVNILLLLLSVLWPLYHLGDQITEGNNGAFVFGTAELVHFGIAGTILAIAFYQNPLLQRAR